LLIENRRAGTEAFQSTINNRQSTINNQKINNQKINNQKSTINNRQSTIDNQQSTILSCVRTPETPKP
jgi:hypothetical protein